MKNKLITLLFSFGLVFSIFFPRNIEAARLYLSPSSRDIEVGQILEISIFIDTEGEYINAADVSLRFDPQKIRVEKSTITASEIEVWVTQPTFSNTSGFIQFIGGVPSPGIKSSSALLSTISFRAVAQGLAYVYFEDGCKVIKNSPEAADVFNSVQNGTYNLIVYPPRTPEITSPSHPDTETWYQDKNPIFNWTKEDGIEGFSYDLDQSSLTIPDEVAESSDTSISYEGVEGIWYFCLRAEKAGVWGETAHYRVKIDSTPPDISEPEVTPSLELQEGTRPEIFLTAEDNISGIGHYEIKYQKDRGSEEKITSGVSFPYQLPFSGAGDYLVSVAAYDEAGNFQEKKLAIKIFEKKEPFLVKGISLWGFFLPWWLIVIVLFILAVFFVLLFVWKRRQKKKEKIPSQEGERGKLDF